MKVMRKMGALAVALWACWLNGFDVPAVSAADRDKLLSEPGIYGTFAAFRIDDEWGRLDQKTRRAQLADFKAVIERHRDRLAIDTYLLRGLSDYADVLLRVHGTEVKDIQQFLVDLQAGSFGRYLSSATVLHGLTKKANYVPGFPDKMKADLKAPSESGPYAAVIPIRKDADWWALPQDQRLAMMQEHTEAALPYHKTVKRKLYHSTGLDDFDFITYFETAKLEDLHSLILALSKVKEARHNKRFGHPTLLGTIRTVDQLVETLGQ
jgi:chlorite dismutase